MHSYPRLHCWRIKYLLQWQYRYRNNLFHGIKDVTTINYQKDNFIYANKMLKLFIETKWNKTQ